MSELNLILHCGAKHATRQQVEEVQTPDSTDTWHPIPHKVLIGLVTELLPVYDLKIVNEAHALFGNHAERSFSLFQIEQSDTTEGDFSLVIGLRNSHDKTFPAGLCCGNGVFVCDNLAFSSEIVVGRRHTKHVMRDLPILVSMAIKELVEKRVYQAERLHTYKRTQINDVLAHSLIIEALRKGVINAGRVPKVVEQWHTPKHQEFENHGKTVWRLFNAFTESLKPSSPERITLANLPRITTKLHNQLDAYCGYNLSGASLKA